VNPDLRLCSEPSCEGPAHIENCPVCYGWGLIHGHPIPFRLVTTAGKPSKWTRCYVCGGAPKGLEA